jgi:acyl-[acyl carrier protein]--UDP-N-acetylglucosamine O-acyltransferase
LSYSRNQFGGTRRESFTTEKIKFKIFTEFYIKNYNTTQAIEIIEAEMEATPERDEILDFIETLLVGDERIQEIIKRYWLLALSLKTNI